MKQALKLVCLKESWVQKNRDKAHIPNLIYVALHILFCEIHIKKKYRFHS